MAARVPKKFKAQLITTNDETGEKIKRNFNNVRTDISDDVLGQLADGIYKITKNEHLSSFNLTANSALDVQN